MGLEHKMMLSPTRTSGHVDVNIRKKGVTHRLQLRVSSAKKEISTYALVNIQIAIENCHLEWFVPLIIVIFHSYVSLPEGTTGLTVAMC